MRGRRQIRSVAAGMAATGLLATGFVGLATAQESAALPTEFDPVSSSWTSAETGYVLGWTPCTEQKYCATLLATEDGGESWERRSAPDIEWDGTPKRVELTFVEQDGTTMGLTNGWAPYVTYDGGETWQEELFGFDGPYDPNIGLEQVAVTSSYVYVTLQAEEASEYFDVHLARTPIGKDQWEQVATNDGYGVGDLDARGSTAIARIGGDGNTPSKVWSTGDGEEWQRRAEPCPNADSYAPEYRYESGGHDRLYLYCQTRSTHRTLLVSDDAGATFTEVGNGPAPDGITGGAAAGDTLLLGPASEDEKNCRVHASFDAGESWQTEALLRGGDPNAVDVQLTDEGTGTVLCSTTGRVGGGVLYRTTDNGRTWEPLELTVDE